MNRTEINVDSFVDIVANSVGVLIIVVVMAIVLSGKESMNVHADRQRLFDAGRAREAARRELAEAVENIREMRIELEVLRARSPAGLEALGRAQERHASAVTTLEAATTEQRSHAERLTDLGTREAEARAELAKAEAAAREGLREVAGELAAEGSGEPDPDLVDRAGREKYAEVKAHLAALSAETETLSAESKRLDASVKELDGTLADSGAKAEALTKELGELLARNFITVEVNDPLAQIERERRPVFAECYTPEAPVDPDGVLRPCVRLFAGGNYEKAGDSLRPTREGESSARVLDADSAYRTYVSGQDPGFRDKHYLYFVVRPRAYAAFRLARKLAWEAGWKVGWGPVAEGESIPMDDLAPR